MVKPIEEIREQITDGEYELTNHALRRIVERNISEEEIRSIGHNVIVIEEYPEDKYGSSCLLLGFGSMNRPLHVQVSTKIRYCTKIITIYEPDENNWINFSIRR